MKNKHILQQYYAGDFIVSIYFDKCFACYGWMAQYRNEGISHDENFLKTFSEAKQHATNLFDGN